MLNEHTLQQLRALRLDGMAAALTDPASHIAATELPFEQRLALLVQREVDWRDSKRLERLLKAARLKVSSACLEDIDWRSNRGLSREVIGALAHGDWLRHGHNVLLTGATGAVMISMLIYLMRVARRLVCTALHALRSTAAVSLLATMGLAVHAQDAPKESTKLILIIEAAAGVNPDSSLRPSPIKVRIYELKDAGAFVEADYFALDTTDKVTLAADMLAKDEFILRPGEKHTIERKGNSKTSAIGVLAGYRDLPNSTWRVVFKLKDAPEASWMRALLPANHAELLIQVLPQGIALTEKP